MEAVLMTEEHQLGLDLMQQGIDRADAGAEKKIENWPDVAASIIRHYVAFHRGTEFTSEDIRLWAIAAGYDVPDENRAWGGPMQRASRGGLITKTGQYRPAKNPKAHCGPKAVWCAN